jgi:hypothetical protein
MTFYTGNTIPYLFGVVDAELALARQVVEWWQEMDAFQFAKPCWQRRTWRLEGE